MSPCLRSPAFFARTGALVFWLAGVHTVARAQTVTAEAAAKDAVVLSPFVVDTSQDRGYVGSSTLAASRLKTDLKDIASSVTVLTDEFMNDLAANDVATALAFVSGAENDSTYHQEAVAALGSANGYVGGDFGDNNNRSGEVRVRGLGRATTTINYMEVLGSTDRYNTDRTEFLRGANSILFGLAEPAGLVNSSTKVAQTRRNFARVETKLDNFGSHRVVLDVNRVLVPGKLAGRIVLLDNDQEYRVRTAYQKDQRGFATVTYQPFKDTMLRAYAERVNANGRRPNFRTVQDNVSDWLAAYNRYGPQMTPAQIAQAFYWDPVAPSATGIAPESVVTLANGSTVNLGLIRRPLDTLATATTLFYRGNGQWQNPLDGVATILSNRTVTGGAVNPATARSQFARSGAARENSPLFSADPQVTDSRIFPYETVEIGALPGNFRGEDVDRFFVSLDQRLAENLYLSASVQFEQRAQEQYFATITQTNQISVDINQRLPDGRTNPNFLRPFIYGRNLGEHNESKARNVVVQANYDFDFAKKTTRLGWLGAHRLTSVYNRTKVDRFGYRWDYHIDNDIPVALTAANIPTTGTQRWAMQVWYVGDPVQIGDTGLRFTGFPSYLAEQQNRSFDYLFFNSTASPAPGVWQRAATQAHYGKQPVAAGRLLTSQINQGVGVSWQSFLWQRRVVTLLGWRKDGVDNTQGVLRPASEFPFPTTPGGNRSDYLPDGSSFSNHATTATQSMVFKVTEQLRLFANRSENFAATDPRQDNLYRPIPPQSGETREYGLGVTLFDGRLDLRVTRFKSSQLHATSASGVAGLRIAAFEQNLYNALSNAGRRSEYTTIDEFGQPTNAPYVRPNNAVSTEDSVSKGTSLEVSFRPNRHWDVVGGVDQLENVATNVGHEVAEFLAVRAPFYKSYFDQGMRLDGTTGAGSSTLLSDSFASIVASNYVNEILKEGISNRGVSKYTARLVGRYKFTEGSFKGFTLGTNVRWESGKVLGYAQKDTTFHFGGLSNYAGRVSDPSKEFRGDPVVSGGMFASYSRRIFSGKVNWRVQLNAQNLFDAHGLRVFAANPDGSPIWAVAPSRAYELSNSFEF